MATYKGQFKPKNPSKYKGNVDKIVFRSSWESKFMNYLDMHPDVIYWSSEEVFVPYKFPITTFGRGFKVRRYFPDFIIQIKTKDGQVKTLMIEIKPHSQTKPPKNTGKKARKTLVNETVTYRVNMAKWQAAKDFCSKHNMQFLVLTEKELFGNGRQTLLS